MVPDVLDFRISSKCNMKCPFCFGPRCTDNLDIMALSRFFSSLRSLGLKYVVLTGGEPTSSPDFVPVVRMLKSIGIKIALSTNGTFWNREELRNVVLSSIDWIALPVESPSPIEHNHLRISSLDHHELIYTILYQIRNLAPNLKIKVGTVASKYNLSSIPNILNDLPTEPNIWKIFQLSKSHYNIEFYNKYKISNSEFEELLSCVSRLYDYSSVQICASYEEDRNMQYLFLEPDGQLMTISGGVEHTLGSYTCFDEETIEYLLKYVDVNRVNSNFMHSFGI